MKLRVRKSKNSTHLHVSGDMQIEQIYKLKKAIEESIESSDRTIISMEKATDMHFSYLPLLCSAHKTSLQKSGCSIELKGTPEVLNKALAGSGFSRHRGCMSSSNKTCLWVGKSDA